MGFIYNGISSRDMGIRARLTNWQLSPSLRNSYVTVPGKAGVADFGCDSAERNIVVKCGVLPQRGFSELVSVLDGAAEWLDPSRGLGELILDDVPDRYFFARLSDAVDCERLIRSAGRFDLKFVCPDPHAYALTDETFVITEPGNHEVRRTIGSAASEPVYSLKGEVSSGASVYITLITNGAELRVVGALASGETLIIDSGKVTAKVVNAQGETLRNGLPCLQELNFPILQKGVNTVAVSVTGGAVLTELKIQAKSRWR